MKKFKPLFLEIINFVCDDVITTSAFEVADDLLEEDLGGIWNDLGGN